MAHKMSKGFTLIEMLVVIAVFGVISVIASQTIILTLQSTHKADAISKVRKNVDYAMGAMERQLHNAKSITQCPNPNNQQISFVDQNNTTVTFSCVGVNNNNQPANIASASGAVSDTLTASDITLTACSFTCTAATGSAPAYVTISITAKDLEGQNAPVSTTTQVTLRSY